MTIRARRAAFAGLCVLTLWIAEISTVRLADLKNEIRLLSRLSQRPASERRLLGTGFAFDPAFAGFLEAVRRRTPPDATIAIAFPAGHELYPYQAAYTLAPRRLVKYEERTKADFAAVYSPGSAPGPPRAVPVQDGFLTRLK